MSVPKPGKFLPGLKSKIARPAALHANSASNRPRLGLLWAANSRMVLLIRLVRAAFALGLFLLLGVLWLNVRGRLARLMPQMAFAVLLKGFGLRVQVSAPSAASQSGTLFISNHVSWTDIAVLGCVLPAGFVAKTEVAGWPIIGRLARRYGCLFVDRGRRTTAQDQQDQLNRLLHRTNIILFPEGTTGNGQALLPFRSSLIGAVGGSPAQCRPVSLCYYWADGTRLDHTGWDIVSWTGDDTLARHAVQLAIAPPLLVHVVIGEILVADCRKTLTAAAAQVISQAVRDSYA